MKSFEQEYSTYDILIQYLGIILFEYTWGFDKRLFRASLEKVNDNAKSPTSPPTAKNRGHEVDMTFLLTHSRKVCEVLVPKFLILVVFRY
jgi:hypothetical protein